MLKRFYADNFRCLTNLELELDEANVLLGANGTGKTSVLDILRRIQDLVVRGRRVDETFPARDLRLGQDSNNQRFEIETCIDSQPYRYHLTVEHDRGHGKMRIAEEVLEHDGHPIFELRMGEAQLYNDEYVPVPNTFPFDWTLSGIGTLYERPNNRKLTRFKREIAKYIVVREQFPKELENVRSRQGVVLVVVTDEDTGRAVSRRKSLDRRCSENGVAPRKPSDPVIVAVPKRNIESWLWHLKKVSLSTNQRTTRSSLVVRTRETSTLLQTHCFGCVTVDSGCSIPLRRR